MSQDKSLGMMPASSPPLLISCQPLVRPNGVIVGSEIATKISKTYPTLSSAIPPPSATGDSFLASIDDRLPLRHDGVREFLEEFGTTLRSLGVQRGHRVALVLPNGPELALAILAVSQWATCVPLSATGAVSELSADLQRCGADLVIGPYCEGPLPCPHTGPRDENDASTLDESSRARLQQIKENAAVMASSKRDWTVHHHVQDTASDLGIAFCGLVPDPDVAGPFRLTIPSQHRSRSKIRQNGVNYSSLPVQPHSSSDAALVNRASRIKPGECSRSLDAPNSGHDEALVLFTSGTTGNKKLVAHQMGDILVAATTIALSWQLKPTDVNCNLMPLFHVGGIVRQVYSPLVSGSAVICCPSFDAEFFWALLERKAFNWYYAAPTMHQIILQTRKDQFGEKKGKHPPLKMIANAAGGLLPSLAEELKSTFQAAILPSYGMTECMPISSPPADYDLSRPGTSGVPVGPEVAILNLSTMKPLPPREEGPICVRGAPCFRGYGVIANDPSSKTPETFLPDGWFNTGDLGFLDEDGYLYVTGRSKEVINRGGEILSPMEIEEAVIKHPDILACAAFSARHDVMQETVGIVIVPSGSNPRIDLPALHSFIAGKLATPKWPQCIVFMEGGLPKSHTNKLLRVKLGQRLGLPELSDSMTPWMRTFEATCPPQGTPLTASIDSKLVVVRPQEVESGLRSLVCSESVYVVQHPSRPGALVAHVSKTIDRVKMIRTAMEHLHGYEVPTHVCFVQGDSKHEELESVMPSKQDAVVSLCQSASAGQSNMPEDPMLKELQEIFGNILDLDYNPPGESDFFQLGGNSMKASQLASSVRRSFDLACSGADIFHHSSCKALAAFIRSKQKSVGMGPSDSRNDQGAPFSSIPLSPQSSCGGTLFQLVPMFVLFPAWQISRYLLFFWVLLEKSRLIHSWLPNISDRSFATFLVAYLIFYAFWITLAPLIFVVIKWTVIGRYREGRYPIWGSYYLRWWFVDVCRKLFLRGIWGSTDFTLRWYYQMLGANIAPNARISSDCDLAEYDLVSVGEEAALELSTVRAFGVDNGAMILGPVRVGKEASVGLRSVVAPYTRVADGTHLGPGTSSYDNLGYNSKFEPLNRQRFPEPTLFTKVVAGFPILFAVDVASQIPPMMVLYTLLWFKSRETSDIFFSNWNELIDWLCDPARIPFFFGIRMARAILSPFFYLTAAIIVKWTVVGKVAPGRRSERSVRKNFRIWLLASLFTRKRVQSVTDLIGRHYEYVSILYRLLGAKVGKRVFWPGNQPTVNGLFDLLEIGDDAVFGSRSSLLCASANHCDKIILCAGANVSDNCIVFPGTVVGKNAVLGSNSIAPVGAYLPSGSVWFGTTGGESACLETGDGSDSDFYQPMADETGENLSQSATQTLNLSALPMIGDGTTIRPFGKAVYLGQAKGYTTIPVPVMVLYTWFLRAFSSVFHTLPLLAAVQLGAVLLYSDHILKRTYRRFVWESGLEDMDDIEDGEYDENANSDKFLWFTRNFDNNGHHHNYSEVFWAIFICFLLTHFIRVVSCLVLELTAKWCIMGRRQPGQYNYDTSSYGQRWELYQLAAKIRKISRLNLLQFISGTPLMNWYFRLNGGDVGKNCCLYPSGADPFMPEPDLVTIGRETVIDCASIVCHLNTRGNFQLAPITIGANCTLRTRSRLQQGVRMGEGSVLLEKSIAMTGEVIDSHSVWQGGPASLWFRSEDRTSYKLKYQPPKDAGENIELVDFK